MIKLCNHFYPFLGKLFLSYAFLLILGRCDIDPGLIDWRLAAQNSLNSFPQSLKGEYLARYSTKFLSGKIDCGKDRLIIQKNSLSLLCGEYLLAYCISKRITEQGKNYKVLCDSSLLWERERLEEGGFPSAFQVPKSGLGRPKRFTISYASPNRIAIVDDFSETMNRIYKKKK